MTPALRLATRGSRLALLQTDVVARLLGADVEPVVISTRGDRDRKVAAEDIPGGPGVFTREVDEAVLAGRADAAVHSAKDLPTALTAGMVIAAVPDRDDPRDALIGSSLDDLVDGAVVATDSPRRRAQLLWLRPDLRFSLLRGNVDTRLRKLDDGEADAIVLAMAGLRRLGLDGRPDVSPLDPEQVMPSMGQGALAVTCAADGHATIERLRAIDRADRHAALDAERAAVATVEGGCSAAVGALVDAGRLRMVVMSTDGRHRLRAEGRPEDATSIAGRLLDEGAREWLVSSRS